MRKKLINGIALGIIFAGAIYVVLDRYATEETVEQTIGLEVLPAAIITIIAIGALSYIGTNFRGMIYREPFGTFSVLLYGVVASAIAGLGYYWVDLIQTSAQKNLEAFIETTAYHAETFRLLTGVGLLGLAVSLVDPALVLAKKLRG